MLDLKDFHCHTGTVIRTGKDTAVEFRDNGKLNTCFLNATTKFCGPIDDKLAMKSLRPGLTVNVWLRDKAEIANYASINFC